MLEWFLWMAQLCFEIWRIERGAERRIINFTQQTFMMRVWSENRVYDELSFALNFSREMKLAETFSSDFSILSKWIAFALMMSISVARARKKTQQHTASAKML